MLVEESRASLQSLLSLQGKLFNILMHSMQIRMVPPTLAPPLRMVPLQVALIGEKYRLLLFLCPSLDGERRRWPKSSRRSRHLLLLLPQSPRLPRSPHIALSAMLTRPSILPSTYQSRQLSILHQLEQRCCGQEPAQFTAQGRSGRPRASSLSCRQCCHCPCSLRTCPRQDYGCRV